MLDIANSNAFLNNVRYIEDGKDYVDSIHTNRPHRDIASNIDSLSAIQSAMQGQVEVWQRNKEYAKGEVVSFISEYFVSLKNNNLENTPKLKSQNEASEWWQSISTTKNLQSQIKPALQNNNAVFDNAKDFTTFTLKAQTNYTILIMSANIPFNETYNLMFDFETNANFDKSRADYPSQVFLTMQVFYNGFKNCNNQKTPELYFHNLLTNTNTDKRAFKIDSMFDYNYGFSGIVFQTGIRRDGTVAILLNTRFDCVVKVSGNYTNGLYASDDSLSVVGQLSDSMFYQVRKCGGDLPQDLLSYIPADSTLLSDYDLFNAGYVKTTNQQISLANYYKSQVLISNNLSYDKQSKVLTLPQSNSEYYIKLF